jgi:hypothetical protein
MGRTFDNALLNLGLKDQYREGVQQLGFNLEDVLDQERDAGLGNVRGRIHIIQSVLFTLDRAGLAVLLPVTWTPRLLKNFQSGVTVCGTSTASSNNSLDPMEVSSKRPIHGWKIPIRLNSQGLTSDTRLDSTVNRKGSGMVGLCGVAARRYWLLLMMS